MSAIAQITNRCVSVASVSRKTQTKRVASPVRSRFPRRSFLYFWLIIVDVGGGEIKCRGAVCFIHHRRRLLSVVVYVAWTKRIWIRAKEVFVRENVHGCARSRGRMRVTRSRGGYRFPRTPHKIISLGSDLCFERRICFFFLFSWRAERIGLFSSLKPLNIIYFKRWPEINIITTTITGASFSQAKVWIREGCRAGCLDQLGHDHAGARRSG